MLDFLATEHQFMELEGTVTLFVHIDLEGGVERMGGDLVVVGEGHDVVTEFFVGVIGRIRPLFALVRREGALHPSMGVEIRPLPSGCGIQVAIGIEDVRTAERPGLAKTVDGAQLGCEHPHHQQQQQDADPFHQHVE